VNGLSDNTVKDMFETSVRDPNFLMDVFHNMRNGLMVLDIDGNIVYFNKAAHEITGYSVEEVKGKQCLELMAKQCMLGRTVFNEDGQVKCDLFRQGAVYNKKCRIRTRDGRSVYLLKNGSVLKDPDGEIIGAVESMTDITSLYTKEMQLECPKQDAYNVVITDLHCPEHCQTALEPAIPVEQASLLVGSYLSLFTVEKKMIEEAFSKANGNMAAAARLLNISYDTIRYRLIKFGIKTKTAPRLAGAGLMHTRGTSPVWSNKKSTRPRGKPATPK